MGAHSVVSFEILCSANAGASIFAIEGGFSGSIRGTIDNVRGCLDAVGAVPVRSGNAEN